MATDSRDRMLETTTRLLRTQGFNGTGLNQIIAESKAPKGSLYYHFPGGKEQLAAEAITLASQSIGKRLQSAFDLTSSPREALDKILEVAAQELDASDFQCGCPVATVALEVAATSEPVQAACSRAFEGAQQLLAGNLVKAGYSAEEAGNLANLMFTAFEGAMMLSRAHRNTQPLQRLRLTLPMLLKAE
ncbi:MAG: TetR/AcrR family transcriptional regulator [Candidatus Eremiobacteraeota bacterium]|nr:TetR/AcrR family transcriptional regulator [Candidatus Eremiobacteraeota bacterium]